MEVKYLINQLFNKDYTMAGIDEDAVERFKQANLSRAINEFRPTSPEDEKENKPKIEDIVLTPEQEDSARYEIKIDAFSYEDFFQMQIVTAYYLDSFSDPEYGKGRIENVLKVYDKIKVAKIGGVDLIEDAGFDFSKIVSVLRRVWHKIELALVELKKNSNSNSPGKTG